MKIKQILGKLSDIKNLLFLIMCLFVHVFNAVLFHFLEIKPLVSLNICSTVFYIIVLVIFNKKNDLLIILTYYEIIIFSLISELICGGQFCYIDYAIGMVAVVFYLLPVNKKRKHFYQFFGILFATIIYQIGVNNFTLFPELSEKIGQYKGIMGYVNLAITLFTLFYVSNLYLFELNTTREKLDYNSNHDALTGLYNRRFFEGIMGRNIAENRSCFSIAMFDVDNFKRINDTYGHAAGDLVLETLSNILSSNNAKDSITVRWGGEEFILYLPQTDEEKAYSVLSDIVDKVRAKTIVFGDVKIKITVTVGLCTGSDFANYEKIIQEADEKLYWGKQHGKNQIVQTSMIKEENHRHIVLYFSHDGFTYNVGEVEKGNTQIVAEYIAEKTWSDIYRIKAKKAYPRDFEACQKLAKIEMTQNARPEIEEDFPDLNEYGTIYIGYPNWWRDVPMCVYTLLEKFNLVGKTIVPFCTHEGNGFEATGQNLKKVLNECKFKDGFEIIGSSVQKNPARMKKLVDKWLGR